MTYFEDLRAALWEVGAQVLALALVVALIAALTAIGERRA